MLSLFLIGGYYAQAQYNMSTTYCSHNDLNAARYEPSELDLGKKRVQISANFYGWLANSSLNFGNLRNVFNEQSISTAAIGDILGSLKEENTFGFGQDFQIIGIAYQIRSKSGKNIDLSLSVVDKAAATAVYSDKFMKLIWKGNKQYAGQNVDFGSQSLNATYNREIALGAAFHLFGNTGKEDGIGMRMGVRAKYLIGLAAVMTEKSNLKLNTALDGSSVTATYDYKINTAGDAFKNFSFSQNNGSGMGLDLGLALYVGKKLEFNMSLLDIGSVTYNANTVNYSKSGTYVYEGAIISQLFGNSQFSGLESSIYEPVKKINESFSVALPTRLLLQAEYKTPKVGQNDREYVSNAIFVTYIQGFKNIPGTTTKPYMSIAYNHDFHKHFDAGLLVGFGGLTNFNVGAFASVNILNTVKIGIGSDNLAAVIIPSVGYGGDVSLNASISF